MKSNSDFYYKYGRYSYRYDNYDDYGGNYYSSTNSVSSKKAQKEKEMKANIPARTVMLKKLFDKDISLSHLPKLHLELWNIIAKYEGGVESSVLENNVTNKSSWYWCSILSNESILNDEIIDIPLVGEENTQDSSILSWCSIL